MTKPSAHYDSLEELRRDWAEAAAAKLRADNIDPNDLEAARACLSECVGGPRLFDYWRMIYHPQMTLFEVTP